MASWAKYFVIHAGLYYGPTSLKTRLCLTGKSLLYAFCARHNIPHSNCGKWIVAQTPAQLAELDKVHAFADSIGVPTHFLSTAEAASREPSVRADAGVLVSPTTGIVDSHALMAQLEGEFQARGGETAYRTAVTGLEKSAPGAPGAGGYTITTTSPDSPATTITAETLVNSAGLAAVPVSNMLLPPPRHLTPYYAKGSYFSYSSPRPTPLPSTLVYPAPSPGHGGLGTHLTLDMAGRVRFGPDVEWVDDPTDLAPNPSRLSEALDEIETYLPGLEREKVGLDYCGIRPKLGKMGAVASGKGFQDFVIRREEGFEGFVNCLGIESPGLTSCLAIGEMVGGMV
ncbi:hypothetical protein MMC20_001677 [Loxospora ochrophaea]|nr:hypothetical protein [Loxospora ochrophaea]